ncbi:MAG: NAD(P)-binding domain-containing protein [Betaproteobacteria bacterium]
MIGLGRRGANVAKRLVSGHHDCVVFDRSPSAIAALATEGAIASSSLGEPRAAAIVAPPR